MKSDCSISEVNTKLDAFDEDNHGDIRLIHQLMPMRNLARPFRGATLVQVSDIHCGPLVSEKRLWAWAEAIDQLRPDFVAFTGDFVTFRPRRYVKSVSRIFGQIRANVAKIACLGNHDYGVWHPRGLGGVPRLAECLCEELAGNGIIPLRNAVRSFFRGEAALQFVGVEDYWTSHYQPGEAFGLADPDAPTITLVHNPDAAPELAAWRPDWILAGHTHGQPTPESRFWDVTYPTRHRHLVAGRYAIGAHTKLYVNTGIGGSFFRPWSQQPEITLFTICPIDPLRQESAGVLDHRRQAGDRLQGITR